MPIMYRSSRVLPKSPDLSLAKSELVGGISKVRFWIARAFELTVYGILIIPFVVLVCALSAFAVFPRHSDSRYDDGGE
jgi:hypothetical protein